MSLENFYYLSQIVASVAVLVSLIYVSLQIRQNTLAQRAVAHQSRSTFLKEHLHLIADASMAPIWVRGIAADSTMTQVEVTRFSVVMRSWCIGMSDIVWAHNHKMLDEETFQASLNALKGMFSQPGARVFWEMYKPTATRPFANLVDGVLAEPTTSRPLVFLDQWTSIIAARAKEGLSV